MRLHPYRAPDRDLLVRLEDQRGPSAADGFEERAVAFVLISAGALGVAIGTNDPNLNATELVLGVALLLVGVRTYARPRAVV